jgi:hypothetical protein
MDLGRTYEPICFHTLLFWSPKLCRKTAGSNGDEVKHAVLHLEASTEEIHQSRDRFPFEKF